MMKSKFFELSLPKDVKSFLLFVVLAIMLAYGAYNTAGVGLDTDIPVVSVVSNSMKHDEQAETSYYQYMLSKYDLNKKKLAEWPLSNGFVRGDLLVVKGINQTEINEGDVIVYRIINHEDLNCEKFHYNLDLQGIDKVVHRVIEIKDNGSSYITKGDHNFNEDPCEIQKNEIKGKIISKLPLLGYLKLIPAEIFGAV